MPNSKVEVWCWKDVNSYPHGDILSSELVQWLKRHQIVKTMNASPANPTPSEAPSLCSICLQPMHTSRFAGKSVSIVTPCRHMFHSQCIYRWATDHITCPIGRQIMVKQEVQHPLPRNWQELMIKGARDGNGEAVKVLLARGAQVDADRPHSETPFAQAAKNKHFTVALMLATLGSTDPEGQFHLGQMYMEGAGTKKNVLKAMDLYVKSADQGNVDAQLCLGCMYMNGDGVKKCNHLAIKWLQKAADQEDTKAEGFLGCIYAGDDVMVRDLNKGVKLLHKAAGKDFPEAQNRLGYLYWKGIHVTSNVIKAQKLLQGAADQGHTIAQINLARLYLENKNKKEKAAEHRAAVALLEAAAKKPHPDALTLLADMHLHGTSVVNKDFARAMELFKLAADLGDVQAHRQLGLIYNSDVFMPADYKLSREHFQKAAEQGDPVAHYHLGLMFREANHFSPAEDHFKQASEKGHAEAQFSLACLYFYDYEYTFKTSRKAIHWFKQAASSGHKEAQEFVAANRSSWWSFPPIDESSSKRMKYDGTNSPLQTPFTVDDHANYGRR